ncbi:hypothetical protein D6D27_09150 [Aureobasidium pullulans]|nr:hypothetical protein D6D27_09150 [Aureobasidium pullulans]
MEAFSNPPSDDRRNFTLSASHETQPKELLGAGPVQHKMADVCTSAREINPGTEMNGNGESRPQVPTWSVANAKEAKPQIIERSDEPEVSKPEARVDADLSNGSHPASADADAQSDIDELLTGGDAEPEPPRYDGDFDIERHDYWWNLLDMENPRHARASKGMRYGTEPTTKLDVFGARTRRVAARMLEKPENHIALTGHGQASQEHRALRQPFSALYGHPERQQRTGFPLLKVGSARKRDDMDDEDSRSPPAELAAKRPRLSSYSGGFSGDGRLSNATPSRPTFDAPPSINGRHYSPVNVPGSVPERERNGANAARHEMDARQYYDSHDSRNDDRYQNHDRYEVSARDMNNLFNLVDKLQREVRTLRSRLDGMETRVDNISGAVDVYRL